jgi:gliding-associated putative ABC transporter substrate-binding component GldG
MMNHKLRYTSSNIVEIIIVVLILVVINYVGYRFFQRFDMTENKQFTISQATKDILGRMDDPVNVEMFLSTDLPPQFMRVRDEVRDRLDEYVAYGRGQFKLKVTDPGDDEAEKERAMQLGVRELEVQITERDALSVKKLFFGLVLSFEDRTETIRTEELVDPTGMEYALTNRLVKLTMEKKPKIGLFVGPFTTSEQQQPPSYEGLRQVLAGPDGMYEIVMIDAQADRQLPDDLDAVIIAGAFGMSESMIYSVDQFIMNGGQVLVTLDPIMQPQQQGMELTAYPSLPTIEDKLEKYGIKLTKQLVVDPSCAQAPMSMGMFQVYREYYLWPQIGPTGFNKDVGAVAQLESLVLPWCCPLSTIEIPGVSAATLATSSDGAFTLNSPFSLNPEQDWVFLKSSAESAGPYDLVCMVSGDLPTAFPNGPPTENQPTDTVEPVTLTPTFDPSAHKDMATGGRVVVIPSEKALSDMFLRQFNQNVLFAVNLMDMMLLGDELLGIRSTPVTARPLKQLTDAEKSFYRWMDVLVIPVLLVLLGLLLWFLKSQRRKAIVRRYGG